MLKKILKIVSILLVALLVAVGGYVAYVFISYSRLPDHLALETENNPDEMLSIGTYSIISYNIGFGAYEDDYDFFMDGGTRSWAISKDRLTENLANISELLRTEAADFYFLQEVDEKGTRTYHVNERKLFTDCFSEYGCVWSEDWNSPFLFYPLTEPHGKNLAGMMTFSRYRMSEAERRSLPIENSVKKLVDLDRCYSITRVPVGDKELVLYNVHLSAYTTDGSIADEQVRMLVEDMEADYRAGNYVVCGGDFNKDMLGNSAELFGVDGQAQTWAQPFPTKYLEGTGLRLAVPFDETNPVPSCRNADAPYHDEQFVLTVDGFIVSENVQVEELAVIDTGFAYSDHNPIRLTFSLREN